MLIPEGGTPGEIVINQCVLQQVVTHVQSVDGLTPDEAAFSQSLPPGEGPRQISSVTPATAPLWRETLRNLSTVRVRRGRYSRSPMSRCVRDGRIHEVGERPSRRRREKGEARLSAQGVQSETSHGR